MPSINVDPGYFTHVKTMRLTALLGPRSEVYPVRLWCVVCTHSPETGELVGWTAAEIEACAGWDGESGRLVDALLRVGFLHRTGSGFRVHDWAEHEGHLKTYRERARKMAAARLKNKTANALSNTSSNTTSNTLSNASNAGQGNAGQNNTTHDARAPDALPEIPKALMDEAFVLFGHADQRIAAWLRDGHPLDWIEKAVRVAVKNGKRGRGVDKYVEACLRNWHKEGKPLDWDERPADAHTQPARAAGKFDAIDAATWPGGQN